MARTLCSLLRRGIACAAILMFVPGTIAAGTNASRPTLVTAVLPFHNATGDDRLEDWSFAFPGLLRMCFSAIESVETPRGKTLMPLVKEHRWHTETRDPRVARAIATNVNANLVVWGLLSGQPGALVADVTVLRLETNGSASYRVEAASWNEAAYRATRQFAVILGKSILEEDLELALKRMASPSAWAEAGKAIRLLSTDPGPEEKIQALNALLAADRKCAFAYGALIRELAELKKTNEISAAVATYARERPDVCESQIFYAMDVFAKQEMKTGEAALREALKAHRGCPEATRLLYMHLMNEKRPTELLQVLEEAHRQRPQDVTTRIFLARLRAIAKDPKGAAELLRDVKELPPVDEVVDDALLDAAFQARNVPLSGLILRRMGRVALTNEEVRRNLETVEFTGESAAGIDPKTTQMPRSYSPAELERELDQRLSAEERALVRNPVEITPDTIAEARDLTNGLPNSVAQIFAIFSEVARRGRGSNRVELPTGDDLLKRSRDQESHFICQDFAKLFVALARAAGFPAWLVHIERDAFGNPGYHDCAITFVNGRGVLMDPAWQMPGVKHQEYVILDDLQAISHHAMQPPVSGTNKTHLRMGLKLNPDDPWTGAHYVRGMVRAGDLPAASTELRRLRKLPPNWNVHEAAAHIARAKERWDEVLSELQAALKLSPSNATVHAGLSRAYDQLGDVTKARTHMEESVRLGERYSTEDHSEKVFALAVMRASDPTHTDDSEDLRRHGHLGDLSAQVAMAQKAFRAGRVGEGLDWLRKAAEQGNANAQGQYGILLLKARPEEAKEAAVWLARAAQQGDPAAQHQLGLLIYEGKAVERDLAQAYAWVLLAKEGGDKGAKWLLDEMELFMNAEDVAKGKQRAAEFRSSRPR